MKTARNARYRTLFTTMAATLVITPALHPGQVGSVIYELFVIFILLSALLAVSDHRLLVGLGIFLTIPAVAAGIGRNFTVLPQAFDLFGRTSAIVVMVLTAHQIVMHVVRTEKVTNEIIFGAMSAYLLVGFIGASVFGLFAHLDPDALRMPEVAEGARQSPSDVTFMYFSFVTLTTLGYGDIQPIGPWSRSFSVLLALTGQLYLAVLLARLVGLYVAHSGSSNSE